MQSITNNILFTLGVLLALCFALLGMLWAYYVALILAYPIGIVSLIIWFKVKKDNRTRNKLIIGILIIGFILSMAMLFYTIA